MFWNLYVLLSHSLYLQRSLCTLNLTHINYKNRTTIFNAAYVAFHPVNVVVLHTVGARTIAEMWRPTLDRSSMRSPTALTFGTVHPDVLFAGGGSITGNEYYRLACGCYSNGAPDYTWKVYYFSDSACTTLVGQSAWTAHGYCGSASSVTVSLFAGLAAIFAALKSM